MCPEERHTFDWSYSAINWTRYEYGPVLLFYRCQLTIPGGLAFTDYSAARATVSSLHAGRHRLMRNPTVGTESGALDQNYCYCT